MNILLESRVFHPSVGGLETMGRELAAAWKGRGHDVRVVTVTPLGEEQEIDTLDVVRQPSPSTLWKLLQWCNLFFQNGVSLRSLGPALLSRKPIVYRHPDILKARTAHTGIRNALKRLATHLGHNIVTSDPVAGSVPGPKTRIPNTYRPMFRNVPKRPDTARNGLLFVGRLVSVKGADLALNALAQLHSDGRTTILTICGDGPERQALEQQARELDVEKYVHFAGWSTPEALVQRYARAEIVLMPSRYEPFGIVALEAIAAGCPVVASRTGGLPEAVGPCGVLVPPDDPEALVHGIKQAAARREVLLQPREAHLKQFAIETIAERYLDVFHSVLDAG